MLGLLLVQLTSPFQQTEASGAATSSALLHYTLPPDKLAQAHALYRIDVSLYVIATIYVFFVLYLMLRMHFAARLRSAAESVSRYWLARAALVFAALFAVLQVLQLPIDAYQHGVRLQYGLSVQGWGSWFGDWAKGLGLGTLVAVFLGWVLYAVLGRSPRRWWLYFWLATIPFLLFTIFIEPI